MAELLLPLSRGLAGQANHGCVLLVAKSKMIFVFDYCHRLAELASEPNYLLVARSKDLNGTFL